MKISVIIPVYNDEKHLRKCLKAFSKQEEKADEIIVVDNNCTDNSMQIAALYPWVKIIKETKQGIISARNAGFAKAKYEIIMKCDADTIPPADWIKRIKLNFEKSKIDALSTNFKFYGIGFLNGPFVWDLWRFFVNNIFKCETLYGACYSLKKTAWEKIKKETALNDRDIHEDIEMSFLLKKYGFKTGYDSNLTLEISGRLMKQPIKQLRYSQTLIKTYLKAKKLHGLN
jgi:glycosyltransferase involved in cell wall biosynthesis